MEIIAQMDGLDVIGHLNLPIRSYHALWMDDAQIQRIMRHLCDHHTAIEINTSALRKSASGELMPDRDLLTLYRQAGGLNVTLGSDAHCAEDLCAGFTKAMEVVQASGLCVGIVKRHVFIPVEDLC